MAERSAQGEVGQLPRQRRLVERLKAALLQLLPLSCTGLRGRRRIAPESSSFDACAPAAGGMSRRTCWTDSMPVAQPSSQGLGQTPHAGALGVADSGAQLQGGVPRQACTPSLLCWPDGCDATSAWGWQQPATLTVLGSATPVLPPPAAATLHPVQEALTPNAASHRQQAGSRHSGPGGVDCQHSRASSIDLLACGFTSSPTPAPWAGMDIGAAAAPPLQQPLPLSRLASSPQLPGSRHSRAGSIGSPASVCAMSATPAWAGMDVAWVAPAAAPPLLGVACADSAAAAGRPGFLFAPEAMASESSGEGALTGCSLCIFGPHHPLRKAAAWLVAAAAFDLTMIIVILASSVCLALYTPGMDQAGGLARVRHHGCSSMADAAALHADRPEAGCSPAGWLASVSGSCLPRAPLVAKPHAAPACLCPGSNTTHPRPLRRPSSRWTPSLWLPLEQRLPSRCWPRDWLQTALAATCGTPGTPWTAAWWFWVRAAEQAGRAAL